MNETHFLVVGVVFGLVSVIFATMSDRRRTRPRRQSFLIPVWGNKADYTSDGWRYRMMASWCLILGIIALLIAWSRLT